ncbi:hypothetical protein H8H81_18550 [Bacillus pumilus]|nr:hypothetical protein [Bacillus pumilus]
MSRGLGDVYKRQVYHISVDLVKEEVKELVDPGIKSIIVFGVPDHKDLSLIHI